MDNTVIEEILSRKRKVINALILYAVSMGMVSSITGLISFYLFVPFLILLLMLIPGYKSLIETVVISSKGVKYITIFKKIDCDWNDILKIEVETSGQTGSNRKNYAIHTSKGTFSLKQYGVWGWNALTLKNAYDKIIFRAPNAEIIQTEVVESIPKNREQNTYGVVATFLLIYGLGIWGLEGGDWYLVLLLSFFLLFILIPGVNSLIETVVISSKGIKYSNDSSKIECDWKDILKIDVETHKQRSEQTGLIISSKLNYIIHTSKGFFSLKESSAWDWNASNLKNAYEKIIYHVPDVEIIHREIETTVSEGK